jgi:integrase
MHVSELNVVRAPIDATTAVQDEIEKLAREAFELRNEEIETSSRRTYTSLQKQYTKFCDKRSLPPFDTGTIMAYIAYCQDDPSADERRAAAERGEAVREPDAASTLLARVAAIRRMAREEIAKGTIATDPTRDVDLGLVKRGAAKRRRRARPPSRSTPLTARLLPRFLKAIDKLDAAHPKLRARDRALVLVSYALARRGAEIADLDVADLELLEGGIRVRMRWSKTNKTGEPEYVGLQRIPGDPRCPVTALEEYIPAWGFRMGPLFRTFSVKKKKGRGPAMGDERMTRRDIQRRIAKIAKTVGIAGKWGAHSPRRGFVSDAEAQNVARSRTRIHTGWKNDAMFATYAEHADVIGQSPLREILAAVPIVTE